MNTSKEKQLVLKDMRAIYYKNAVNRVDWMGYLITEDNKPSYHHIVKKEVLINNGISCAPTVENGAYLGTRSHELLHQLELIDHDLYECWNDLFLMINKMRIYPIPDVWDMVYHLQDLTVKALSNYKSGKIKTK
ncbi:MAG: hypothetical protein K6C11_01405 [Bacilli bacterium]|nr:hypothetical protein [Bacilli bacterium]